MSMHGEDFTPDGTDDDFGTFSLDDEDQLSREDTLMDGPDDLLDQGYAPADKPLGSRSFGTTAAEQAQGESLEQRLRQENPDDPRDGHDPRAHVRPGEERDADLPSDDIDADDDFLADGEVGDQRSGRLVAPDEGAHEDQDSEMWAADVGIDGGAASAEEAAMHIVQENEY